MINKKNKKNIFKIKSFVLIFYFFTNLTYAAHEIVNPFTKGGDSLNAVIKTMVNGLLTLAIPFLVAWFVYVGFLFTKAQGDPEQLKGVKKAFVWGLVGAAIIIGANTIFAVVEDTWNKSGFTERNEIVLIKEIC